MKTFKVLGVIGFFITMVCIGFSFFAPGIFEKELVRTMVHKAITEKVEESTNAILPYVYDDDQVKQISAKLDQTITENKQIDEITMLYLQAGKKTISSTPAKELDHKMTNSEISIKDYVDEQQLESNIQQFSTDIVHFIEQQGNLENNTLSQLISNQMVTKLTQILNDRITNQCDISIQRLPVSILSMMQFYIAMTSTTARIVLVILAVLFLAFIVIGSVPRTTCLLPGGIVLAVAGAGWLIMSQVIKNVFSKIIENTGSLNSTGTTLEVGPWVIYGAVLLGIGIVLSLAGAYLQSHRS